MLWQRAALSVAENVIFCGSLSPAPTRNNDDESRDAHMPRAWGASGRAAPRAEQPSIDAILITLCHEPRHLCAPTQALHRRELGRLMCYSSAGVTCQHACQDAKRFG